ncbi:response regulator [Cryomorpha ignava]|uniref:histidine kinase n=1 Tax=Cryomorpha ignava TaxID=101383 RepID=A0A7K3WLF8_9FLAO|nr:ATP-binding protein [Cryomorpha ignava]NEN22480.1 response regulator [Cryomorpha ignava]
MKKTALKYASKTIGQKVLVAVILSILFLVAAVYITKLTFQEVNNSISRLSITNEQNKVLNKIYNTFGEFERSYQAPLIANPFANTDDYYAKLDSLNQLIDSTTKSVNFQMNEQTILDSVAVMILRQDKHLMAYRALKRSEQPLLRQNLDSLINLISAEEILKESDIITTTKSTRRIPAEPVETPSENNQEEKKSWFGRIFGSNSEKEVKPEVVPEIIEETYIRVDTIPLAKSDTSSAKAGNIIKGIRRDQAYQQRRVRDIEMEIVQNSARIQNFLLTTIRHAEEVELTRIRNESADASGMMQNALTQMYLVLLVFALLATVLVYRILTDLANAKYYRIQLVEEKERAENLSKVKERFLANMSHEIRTPLQNILGYSEKLFSKDKNRDAEIINQSSEHLLQIVNQVLDFSRISTGKLVLNPEVIDVKALLLEVVNSMSIQAANKDIRIFFESEIDVPNIYIDPFRLRQILYNLLGNAVKFTEAGFIKLFAKTAEKDGKIHLLFSIEDSGIGMTKSDLECVFQEFEQVGTPMHASNGTGLGLSITKALVDAYHGTIDVKSEKNEGTTFTVSIDLAPKQKDTEADKKTTKRAKMHRILVVDDDETILNLTRQILTGNGFDVVAESSPLNAIEIAKKQKFDMALVDFRMPEMTGAELRDALRKLQPALPVVAVTANVFEKNKSEESVNGFDFYLPKPFKTKQLLELVGFESNEIMVEYGSNGMKEKLAKLTFGDARLEAELIEQFKKDCAIDLSDLKSGIENKDGDLLHETVHKLGGRLGLFEFATLAGKYKMIEIELMDKGYSESIAQNISSLNQNLYHELTLI